MVKPKTFYTFARGIKILLLLLLIGVECMLNLSGDNAASINQAALQLTRSQILVNSVYTLAYRPVAEQGQALHDLQITLPPFEQEQTHLLTNTAVDVQILLQQARTDYLPLIAALQVILVHPHSVVNPLEINIIVLHEHSYLTTMNALLLTLPRHSQDHALQLFVIQIVIEVLFIIVFVIVMTTFVWEVYTRKNDKACPIPLHHAFFVRRLVIFVLVLVLVALEMIPLGVGDDVAYLNQATLQRTRCELFDKSVFVLAYRPATERTQALSDVQFVLPIFQQEQAILFNNTDARVHNQVQAANVEYQTMITAVQVLASNPGKSVEPALVNTIVSHTPTCLSAMNGIVLALQNQIEQKIAVDFYAEIAIEGALLIFFTVLLLFGYDPFVSLEQRKARGLVN